MKPYENWRVVKFENNKNKRAYFYGNINDVKEEIEEEFSMPYEIIPEYDYTANDWLELCVYELENANRHSFMDFPHNFLSSLRNYEHSEEACTEIMRIFAVELWDTL